MRVLLADDHTLMRQGLRAILEKTGIEIVGEAADGQEAIDEVRRLKPSVVLMDIGMPGLNGIEATKRLTAELMGIKVIALSMNADQRYVMAMLEAGVVGYLLKNSAAEELLLALEAVGRGENYLSPAIARGVVSHAVRRGTPPPTGGQERPLSARERDVLQLVAEGKSSKEIGVALQIAVPTVETYRRQIMDKLQLRTIAELTKYAIREGITSSEP